MEILDVCICATGKLSCMLCSKQITKLRLLNPQTVSSRNRGRETDWVMENNTHKITSHNNNTQRTCMQMVKCYSLLTVSRMIYMRIFICTHFIFAHCFVYMYHWTLGVRLHLNSHVHGSCVRHTIGITVLLLIWFYLILTRYANVAIAVAPAWTVYHSVSTHRSKTSVHFVVLPIKIFECCCVVHLLLLSLLLLWLFSSILWILALNE